MWSNLYWKNLARSSLQSRAIPALVPFFLFSDPLFWFWVRFWVLHPSKKKKKKQLDIQKEHFMLVILKKKILKISKNKKARLTLKIFGGAISSHLIAFRFFLFSGQFRKVAEHLKWSSGSRNIWFNRRKKNQADISRGTDFIAYQKNPYFVIYSLYIYN